jgi:eukaryotic-like serine/threonine-protein kinase
MTPETWVRVTQLFDQVLDLGASERASFLARLHASDPPVATEVASLLEAHERDDEFLPDLPSVPALRGDISGRTVGSYRLIRPLGTGGMGTVYLAERSDGAFAKQVAVKLLSAAFLQSRDRFLREREFLARLEHPNIARLLDAGTSSDDVPYIVMEYVEGVPIDRYCAEREPSLDDRLALLLQVCAGVAHAHQNLIVHCDIKPENILVTADGRVKLLDFGIARLLDPARDITLHRPATPAYSSPEQLRGDPITTATDVYAVGALAYVVLTGRGPYRTRSHRLEELLHAVLTAEPARPSDLAPQCARLLRGDLDNVLLKAVARDPHRRYASVQQLGDDVDAHRRGFPVRARPDTFMYRAGKAVSRHRVASAAAVVAMLSLATAAIVSTWQARVAQRRFEDLREFAHTIVFDVNDALSPIPGTTAPRKLVVETALRYLDRLNDEHVSEPSLREELAAAYIRIGKVQGGAFLPNLGDSAGAIASFRKAIATTGSRGETAELERLRLEALINIAQLAEDPIEGAPHFDAAIAAAQQLLANDAGDLRSLRLIADAYHGRATVAHLVNDVGGHALAARRQLEVRQRLATLAPGGGQDAASLARAFAQHALALEQQGRFDEALAELHHARGVLDAANARSTPNQLIVRGLAEVRSRTVSVLLPLGRIREAMAEVEAAVAMLQPLVASDANNVQYRSDLAYAWLRLGDSHRAAGDLGRALEFHRRALDVRRERAERHGGFIFIPWELTRSLNTTGELLLASSPPRIAEAAALFTEARVAADRALSRAPSFTQVRKQAAIADEGLARCLLLGGQDRVGEARRLLTRSMRTWQEIRSRTKLDSRDAERPRQLELLLDRISVTPQ